MLSSTWIRSAMPRRSFAKSGSPLLAAFEKRTVVGYVCSGMGETHLQVGRQVGVKPQYGVVKCQSRLGVERALDRMWHAVAADPSSRTVV